VFWLISDKEVNNLTLSRQTIKQAGDVKETWYIANGFQVTADDLVMVGRFLGVIKE